jgi:hypothetical protein
MDATTNSSLCYNLFGNRVGSDYVYLTVIHYGCHYEFITVLQFVPEPSWFRLYLPHAATLWRTLLRISQKRTHPTTSTTVPSPPPRVDASRSLSPPRAFPAPARGSAGRREEAQDSPDVPAPRRRSAAMRTERQTGSSPRFPPGRSSSRRRNTTETMMLVTASQARPAAARREGGRRRRAISETTDLDATTSPMKYDHDDNDNAAPPVQDRGPFFLAVNTATRTPHPLGPSTSAGSWQGGQGMSRSTDRFDLVGSAGLLRHAGEPRPKLAPVPHSQLGRTAVDWTPGQGTCCYNCRRAGLHCNQSPGPLYNYSARGSAT